MPPSNSCASWPHELLRATFASRNSREDGLLVAQDASLSKGSVAAVFWLLGERATGPLSVPEMCQSYR